MIVHTLKNIKIVFLAVLLIKLCVDDQFIKPVVLWTGENAVYKYIDAILKECNCCKIIIKEHFNQNLIISEDDEERFQLSNKSLVCN